MAASRKSTILGAAMRCTFFTKEGHEEKECWTKNPALKQAHRDKNTSNKTMKNYRKPFRCYNCGKVGHRKRECTALKETSNIAMAAKYNGTGATDIYPAMVDSGCSVHLVKDMKLLDAGTIQEATGSLCLADGSWGLHLKHKKWLYKNYSLGLTLIGYSG